MKIVVATRNQGKAREIRELLGHLEVELVSVLDFPDVPEIKEDSGTFEGNAVKKAREVARRTGLPSLADDSGLEVDALEGRPGVLSSRFAGPDATDSQNVERLLSLLSDAPADPLTARFTCVAAFASPEGRVWTAEGTCEGEITLKPRGSGGFGYDPVFLVPEYGRTMAELPRSIKNRISHRAKAIAKLCSCVVRCAQG